MNTQSKYPLLRGLKEQLIQSQFAAGLAEQIDLLSERYGDEYQTLAENVLILAKKMNYDAFMICQQYIFDYLQQLQKFLKTGNYGHDSYSQIKENIYDNSEVMMNTYMPGLFLAYSTTTILYTKYHLFKNKFLPLLDSSFSGVEVGFGEGFYLWELNNHIPNINITGYDISQHAVNFAASLLQKADIMMDNCNLLLGNIVAGLPVEDEAKDYAILAEVIEHIPNPERGVAEISRILKRGGKLYLTTVKDSNHMDHMTNFESPDTVIELLQRHNFNVLDKSIYKIQQDFPKTKDISVGLAFVCEKI